MSEWKESILDESAVINPSESLPKGTVAKKVAMEVLNPFTKKVPSYSLEPYNGGMKFRNGDTIVARITPCLENGKTAYIDFLDTNEIGYGSTEYIVLREKEGITDKQFLYYFSISNEFRDVAILSMTGSSGRQRVQTDVVKNHSFLLPPLPEQKAIAGVLSSLDDKIDLLHRQNKTLEAMAEALFRQWFVEEADEGWEEGKLSQLVEIQSGFAFKSEIFVDIGKYKLITIKAVQDGYLELNNADEINEIPPRMPSYCHLIEKDILLSLTGNVGRCCMVDKLNLLLNQRVAKVHPKNENDRAFAYFYFRLRDTRQQLEEMAKGTAQLNLSPVETANMILSIPSRDLLDKFSEISTPLFEGILRNKKNISTLEKLRDTLLPKLMSGEVRVKV